jgi:C1A family cysteine protease
MLWHRTVRSLLPTILLILTAAVWAQPALAAQSPGDGSASGATTSAAAPLFQAAPLNPESFPQSVPGFKIPVQTPDGYGLGGLAASRMLYAGPDLSGSRSVNRYAASFDLRSSGKVSSVKDQNPWGTCWSFAACGSMESALLPGESRDFAEDNMVLTSGFDTGSTAAEKYDWGGHIWMSTAYLSRWGGPVWETDDTYGDSTTPGGLAARKHVQEVLWFAIRTGSTDNDRIKYAVSTYGATDVSMSWQGSSSGSTYYNPTTHAYYYNGSANTNHEVLVVGWDDNYAAANFATAPPGNGAFIVKNSWGTGWGDGGYFYASYYDTRFGYGNYAATFNRVQDTTNYGGIYQYDPLGDCSELGASSSTCWFANVFTAQSTTSLTAVGFYTVTPNTTYEVYAGASLAAKSLCTSGTMADMGFHTVSLPSPVPVSAGSQFAVCVKVNSPGTTWPVAFEAPYTDYSSAAAADPGQSYVGTNGSVWSDLTTLGGFGEANVCLKAYVAASPPPPSDVTAPTTTLLGLTAAGWTRSDVSLTLQASDDMTGVARIEYQLGAGAWTTYTAPVVVSTEGETLFSYRAVDNAGNTEVAKSATVRIDKTGPVTTASKKLIVKKNKKATFKFSASDRTATAKFSIRIYQGRKLKKSLTVGSKPCGSPQSYAWKRCTLAKGSYTWKVYATDEAGNAQSKVGSKGLVVK